MAQFANDKYLLTKQLSQQINKKKTKCGYYSLVNHISYLMQVISYGNSTCSMFLPIIKNK